VIALCLDAGSSSLKFALYRQGDGNAECERIASGNLSGLVADANATIDKLWAQLATQPDAIGHRIVFGGPAYVNPTLAHDAILLELETFVPVEPLHLRAELDLVYAAARKAPQLPQVLCFDTAFHQRMPTIAKRLPLPASDPLLRRYGFHGLSYEYIVSALADGICGRTIVAHLGSGASLCALRDGEPVDTTMGFSALGGLMMATRPGDLDPGAILQLMRSGYDDCQKLSDLLYHRCGLLAASGESGDMRTLAAGAASDVHAREAIELFGYQLLKHTGSMIAVLGGLDALVFTGGIGEHDPSVRSTLSRALHHTGLRIDEAANAGDEHVISTSESTVTVRVIPTDENLMIARHTFALL